MFSDPDRCAASFCYDGAFVPLVPAEMRCVGGNVYESALPDGLTAVLERSSPAPGAYLQKLSFLHRGQEDSGVISRICALDAMQSAAGEVTWESLKGDSCGEESFAPLKRTLDLDDNFRVEPRFGRPSDTTGFGYFDLCFDGHAATFAVGWGGQWFTEFTRTGAGVRIQAGLPDAETYLRPGERITCPTLLWVEAETIPAARLAFRRLLFDCFSPKDKNGGYLRLPVAFSCYDRFHDEEPPVWATVAGQKECAEIACACHMDTLWLDAAWFEGRFPNGVGNYTYAPGFPEGVGEVSDYAHRLGLRFLQWFEPERANCYSETVRDHPEDVIVPDSHGSVNCLVNIGNGRTRRRVTDLLKERIRDSKLDVYRQDYNICPSGYWRSADGKGRRGMTEIRFVEGHRAMWDEILASFPGILIDNCASGGRRLDFESLRRSVPLWRSDTGCFPVTDDKRVHTWSQNQILTLSRYLPYHSCGSWEQAPYNVRSAFAGGICCDFDYRAPDFSPQKLIPLMDELHRLQPYWTGDFYPLTAPTNDETVWAAWQLTLGDAGAAWAFRRDACPQDSFALRLNGIDGAKTYEVLITDEHMRTETLRLPGSRLACLTVTCPEPKNSVAVEYRALD